MPPGPRTKLHDEVTVINVLRDKEPKIGSAGENGCQPRDVGTDAGDRVVTWLHVTVPWETWRQATGIC